MDASTHRNKCVLLSSLRPEYFDDLMRARADAICVFAHNARRTKAHFREESLDTHGDITHFARKAACTDLCQGG